VTQFMRVEIEGLREFRRAVGNVDKGLKKEIRLVLNDAADLVVKDAKPKVPQRSGKAAGSIRALSTQTMSRVAGGGARVPYYPWLDFGGNVGKGGSVKRAYSKVGRYIYPSYRRKRDSGVFQDRMLDGLNELGERAGLDMS